MSGDNIVLIVGGLLVLGIALLAFVYRTKRIDLSKTASAARESAAAQRGWRLEATGRGDDGQTVYSGITESIAWRCEMTARLVARPLHDQHQQATHTRWSTSAARSGGALLIVTAVDGGADLIPANLPPEMIGLLGPLLKTLGLEGTDAPLLAGATSVEEPALNPHYRLRASDVERMQRFLDSGAREALIESAPWLSGSESHPLVLLTLSARGLSIVVQGWIEDLDHVERLARLGARLARST